MDDILKKIREIRSAEGLTLKPSPYLRTSYEDESGAEQTVRIRNYQTAGIMNLLQVERMILGDDTGLGKTLMVLSMIGYVWMREPEYVPVVLTKKSALFQWGDEIQRFMHGMEAVTADGEPYERHKTYREFFSQTAENKKKLLVLTYDSLLKDSGESVIRDRDHKPDRHVVKQSKELRKELRASSVVLESMKEQFRTRFSNVSFDAHQYVRSMLSEEPISESPPASLTEADLEFVRKIVTMRDAQKAGKDEISRLNDLIAPPKRVQGVITWMKAFRKACPSVKFMLVMDEQHVLKNHKGRVHLAVQEVSAECDRIVGMTATPVKNKLMEFFSLFRIIKPKLMPTIKKFHDDFCVTKLQPIGGGRKVPIVVGYKNLDKFVELIEPYYLSRRKYDVAKELPKLVSREIRCELSDVQQELYDMAEVGLIATASGPSEDDKSEMLKAMTLVQQAVDAPGLIMNEERQPYEGPSCKEQALLELLEDELDGQKVIVFSRFERMVSLLEKSLNQRKVKTARITGKENATEREKAKKTFQNMKSGVDVILITTAGAESINLQAAEHIVFVDSPWSWGDYVQITGRSIRIGSQYVMVVATHLVAVQQNGKKTIDDHVIKILKSKKALADKVAGEALKGGLEFVQGNDVADIFSLIRDSRNDAGTDVKALREEVGKKIAAVMPKKRAKAGSKEVKKARTPPSAEEAIASSHSVDLSDI